MACGGCRKNGGNRHTSTGGDLTKFGFLTPRQLRLLKAQQEAEAKAKEESEAEEQE